jgi:hypothetical protein
VNRVRRAALALALAVVGLGALSGGGCRPAREVPPDPGVSYPADLPEPTGTDEPLDRRAYAPVPSGYAVTGIAFVDADQGYALFQRCDQPHACKAVLAVTLDGGNSWLTRDLPFTPREKVSMALGRGDVLLLHAEPLGWFVTKDTGRTFEQRPSVPTPVEGNLVGPQFVHRTPQVLEVSAGGTPTALPADPPVGDIKAVQLGGDGRLWAAGRTRPNEVAVAVSTDRGRTWRVSGTMARTEATPQLAVSPNGADVWLVGNGYGYRLAGPAHWEPVAAMSNVAEVTSAVALGDGVLLLAGPRGAATVTAASWVPDAPPEVGSLRDLGRGVIQGNVRNQVGTVWLCRCRGTSREWVRITPLAP